MKFALLILLSSIMTTPLFASPLVGYWKTIDDKTNEAKSFVKIAEENGKFAGSVAFIIAEDKRNDVCDKCKGELKDKPILGMTFMWDFVETKSGEKWENGEILDPENGKIYSCKLTLEDEGKKLDVRGFIGISLFGRTQVWERSSEEEVMGYQQQSGD